MPWKPVVWAGVALAVLFLLFQLSRANAAQGSIRVGERAPDFELPDQSGRTIRLSDYAGKRWVVLYFYPKDDTPGCTKEACSFRDNLNQLQSLNAAVLGVSVDDVRSHAKFAEKFELNFPILSDSRYEVCEAYGTLTRFMGIKLAHRTTFIIDPEGIVRRVFPKVKPQDHAIEVAAALKTLQGQAGTGIGD